MTQQERDVRNADICKVYADNPDMTREALAARFSVTADVVRAALLGGYRYSKGRSKRPAVQRVYYKGRCGG